jgi:hypothetical protein
MSTNTFEEDGKHYRQVLRIEIDGSAECFHGNHTPGICEVLRTVADQLEAAGIQMIAYPVPIMDESSLNQIGQVDLIEEEVLPTPQEQTP